jgi:hypothetical protein
MSDVEESVDVKPFAVERAKQGRAKCQKCKNPCEVIIKFKYMIKVFNLKYLIFSEQRTTNSQDKSKQSIRLDTFEAMVSR